MSLDQLYSAFALLGLIAEVALVVVLLVRRQYLHFPIFSLYIVVSAISDLIVVLMMSKYPPHTVRAVGFALLPLQYLLQLGVLLEIAWNVLQPVHASLPRGFLRVFLVTLVLAIGGGVLLGGRLDSFSSRVTNLKDPLDLTFGILRMLIFAATASFAQMLGIGWKNKVLQLATALSFYSAIDLIISMAERIYGHAASLEPIQGVAYALQLGFLVYAFTTKDVVRREFSPQMEQFLVTLAGRAKHARTVLVRMQVK